MQNDKRPTLVPELYCSNLEKTLFFYTDILGFHIFYSRIEEKFVYLKRWDIEIMFEEIWLWRNWITGKLEYPYGRWINFQIEVSDVEQIYKNIQNNNINLFLALEEKWYQRNTILLWNKQFIVQDPDGYLLRFYQNIWEKSLNN